MTALVAVETATVVKVVAAPTAVAVAIEVATDTAAGGVVATMPAVEPVPFCAIAICSNIAWVLLAVGLIENVMPFPQ